MQVRDRGLQPSDVPSARTRFLLSLVPARNICGRCVLASKSCARPSPLRRTPSEIDLLGPMAHPLQSPPGMKSQPLRFVGFAGLALLASGAPSPVARAAESGESITGQVTTSSPKQRANVVVYLEKSQSG